MNSINNIGIPDRELEVIACFNRHMVRYLIIGGYAMLYYGDNDRSVEDLDIWISNDSDNATRCHSALKELIPGNVRFPPTELEKPAKKIDLSQNMFDVDILTSVSGVQFKEAYKRRKSSWQGGEQLEIVRASDLLTIKKKAFQESKERREKEAGDIEFLESLEEA